MKIPPRLFFIIRYKSGQGNAMAMPAYASLSAVETNSDDDYVIRICSFSAEPFLIEFVIQGLFYQCTRPDQYM